MANEVGRLLALIFLFWLSALLLSSTHFLLRSNRLAASARRSLVHLARATGAELLPWGESTASYMLVEREVFVKHSYGSPLFLTQCSLIFC